MDEVDIHSSFLFLYALNSISDTLGRRARELAPPSHVGTSLFLILILHPPLPLSLLPSPFPSLQRQRKSEPELILLVQQLPATLQSQEAHQTTLYNPNLNNLNLNHLNLNHQSTNRLTPHPDLILPSLVSVRHELNRVSELSLGLR